MSKHVIIDGRKLGDGGIGVYIENLIDGYLECPELMEEFRVSVLVSPEVLRSGGNLESQPMFVEPFDRWMLPITFKREQLGIQQGTPDVTRSKDNPDAEWAKISFVEEKAKKYSLGEYLLSSGNHRSLFTKNSVFHAPHFTVPFFLPIPAVVTVHDCIHLSYPRKSWHSFIAKSLLRSALRRTAQVITVSEESKERIRGHFSPLNVSIEVIPNALRYGFSEPGTDLGLFLQEAEPYALFVGNDRPHKGFRHLLAVWRQLLDTKKDSLPTVPLLVVVGEGFSSFTMETILELGLANYVRFFGAVPTKTLAGLYRGANCVVLPSVEEGFGIVALEAKACGVPLVCNRLTCLMELCGEEVWYADWSIESWVEAVISALSSSRRVSGVEIAQKYQRASVARKTFAVYRRVLTGGRGHNIDTDADAVAEIGSQRRVRNATQRGNAKDYQKAV